MLTYALDGRGQLPLYEALYRRIREDILSGTLPAGTRLPSRRALAEHLNLSVITVEGAYRQLEAEGYLRILPRRGAFVEETGLPGILPSHPEGSNALEPPPHAERAGVSQTPPCPEGSGGAEGCWDPEFPADPDSSAHSRWKLDLASSRTDISRFPAATWARLTRQVLSEDMESLLLPSPHQGLWELRSAISRRLREEKGMEVPPERLVVGAGAEYLYLLLAQLLGRAAPLAVEDPGYPRIRQVYEACGVRWIPLPLERQGLDMDALYRSGACAAHISPAHHYPTGIVMPIGRRRALLRWAEERGGYLIEDDYDSDFRFTGRPIPTLKSIDTGGRVIYLNTFSQTISPAIRLGYMVLPPELTRRYNRELGFYACPVSVLEQHVLARFLDCGHYEKHLSRMRKEYRLRRTAVLDAFRKSSFADRITLSEQDAGLHFLLGLKTGRSDEALRRRGEALGVRLRFLSEYAVQPSAAYDHTLVVNYALLRPESLPEAMELLAEVFREEA